jgi:hypothetical protein
MISALDFQKAAAAQKIKELKEMEKAQKLVIKEAERKAKEEAKEAERQVKQKAKEAEKLKKTEEKQAEKQKAEEIKELKEKAREDAKRVLDELSHVTLPDLTKVLSNGQKIYHSIKLPSSKVIHEIEGIWEDGKVSHEGKLLPPQAFLTAHSLALIEQGLIKRQVPHSDMWSVKGQGLYIKTDDGPMPLRLLKPFHSSAPILDSDTATQ